MSYNCLDRHVEAGRGDRVAYHWEGEPGDTRTITYADLHDGGVPVRQRAQVARREQGRPGQHLPADDPRAAGGDARVRPHRRPALGGVRRLLGRRAQRPHQRRRGQGAHHRRRRLAAGRGRSRSRPTPTLALAGTPSIEHVVVVRRTETDVDMDDGRDHWYHDLMAGRVRRLPARADGRRGPPLPALHLGHDREAQGHHAHDGRLSHPGRVHPQVRVRPASRDRRLLVRGRHRLGHRAQLHRLRAARQRRHVGDVRGHARHPGEGPAVVDRRALRRHASSTPRPPRSARS